MHVLLYYIYNCTILEVNNKTYYNSITLCCHFQSYELSSQHYQSVSSFIYNFIVTIVAQWKLDIVERKLCAKFSAVCAWGGGLHFSPIDRSIWPQNRNRARLSFKFQTLCEILPLNIGDRHSANCGGYECSFIPRTNAEASLGRYFIFVLPKRDSAL